MEERLIAVGQITSAHGVAGVVNVWPLSDAKGRFQRLQQVLLGESHRPVQVKYVGRKDPLVLLQIEGITTREAAEALKGQYLRVPVSQVPPAPKGNPYVFELVGQPVVDPAGTALGVVQGVEEGPAYNFLVVKVPAGSLHRVPIVDAFVQRLESDPPVVLTPIPGLLDQPE